MAPFFGEIGIDPLAKPALLMSPTEAFGDEDLTDAAALHANAFDPVQVLDQPIQCPDRVVLSHVARLGESRLDDAADLLWGVGRRPIRAGRFFQSLQSLLVKAVEPIAHHAFTDFELLCNLWRRLPLASQPDDLGPFQFPDWRASGMHQALNRPIFFFCQCSQSQHPLASLFAYLLVLLLSKLYHICRMHHLEC
jgi:hypothetical protein